MKAKTAELTGRALAWAVGIAEGCKVEARHTKSVAILFPGAPRAVPWNPHSDWSQGGPIIEREGIEIRRWAIAEAVSWRACSVTQEFGYGPNHLIAAMRCYVANKLGDEIDLPEELQ